MTPLKLSKERELELYVLGIWLFLIRIAIPFVKYLFAPYFVLFLAYTIFNIVRSHDYKQLKSYYFRVCSSFFLVCFFFLIGVLLSSRLNFYFRSEGLAMCVL